MNAEKETLALASISLGLAFLCSWVIPVGSLYVDFFLSGPVLWDMRGIPRQLPMVLGNYWIPAIAIYLILRFSRIPSRFDPPRRAHVFVALGNVLLIIYLAIRLAASTIPGGGAGFVVASIGGPLLAVPGYVCLIIGLLYAISRRAAPGNKSAETAPRMTAIGVAEGLGIVAACAVPIAGIFWLYGGTSSPFRIAREAEARFIQRCQEAGESFQGRAASIQGLFIEKDEGFVLNGLKNGVYEGIGFGSLGNGLQAAGLIEYFEVPRGSNVKQPQSGAEYLRFLRNAKNPVAVGELASEYALQWRDTAAPADKALKISGSEYSLVNRRSGERIATAVFFVSAKHRKICGVPGGHSYAVSDFVRRAVAAPLGRSGSR